MNFDGSVYSRCFPAVLLSGMLALGAGCSADAGTDGNPSSRGPGGGDGGSAGDGMGGSGGTAGAGGIGQGGFGGGGVGGAGGTGVQTVDGGVKVGDIDGCVGQTATAPPAEDPKVDIVWVVDASLSMLDEQIRIGRNLTQFADDITKANRDIRIVMMTTAATLPGLCGEEVPPDPMTGTALDGNPRYRFINTLVDSGNSLDIALNNLGQYQDFLRPNSKLHYVMVSDDESGFMGLPSPQERAQQFQAQMSQQLGRDFTLHTISSEGPSACTPAMCDLDLTRGVCSAIMLSCGAAAPGATYYELANMTQGLTASICETDWTKIFEPLTQAVIKSAPLPCSYEIPEPPDGQNLNPDKVNVGWTPPGGDQQIFPRAEGQQECGDELAWYYDNPEAPQKVEMCPRTCERISQGGTISIAFDCDTIVIE